MTEPTKEDEYMAYLTTPRSTAELCEHFSAKEHAVWQMLRTLRLKQLIQRVPGGRRSHWSIVGSDIGVPHVPLTAMQAQYIEYLRTPHTTREMMEALDKNESAVQQVTRTLRLMGYVQSVGHGSPIGKAGCWFIWKSTGEGMRALEAASV